MKSIKIVLFTGILLLFFGCPLATFNPNVTSFSMSSTTYNNYESMELSPLDEFNSTIDRDMENSRLIMSPIYQTWGNDIPSPSF